MTRPTMLPFAMLAVAGLSAASATASPVDDLRAAETAFAQSMADRDFAAFANLVADDAVFLNSGNPLRGKAAVLAHWKKFFEKPEAPFAWKPELAEVSGRGDIGATSGPVTVADGKLVAFFQSTWRREPDGRWQIVFDNGFDACTHATK